METGNIRIIGGHWRSRKLHFPAVAGLRPTPDRVRETLFNWLSPVIVSANCLDLFAGSGALSFEALSRGAAHVVMIDKNASVIAYLREQLTLFDAKNATLLHSDALAALTTQLTANIPTKKFDIVFLDPPFQKNLLKPCCEWLIQQNLLAPHAYIYIEAEANLDPLPIPSHWQLFRSKKTRQVGYHLIIT